ncbi:MAG: helix-turn-helix domain-containing protein [Candidatus Nanopelagicales bacterium]
MAASDGTPTRSWTLLTNHGRVLLLIGRNTDARLRDLAAEAGITERAAQTIVGDLEAAGYVTRVREGRRNTYVLHPDQPFRHPAEADHEVGELLALFGQTDKPADPS